MKHLKRFNEISENSNNDILYSSDIVDLFIDDQVIKNGISGEVYEHFKHIKGKDNYIKPRTDFGFLNKDEALGDLLNDYLTNHTFDILEKLSIDGKEITKNMHYFYKDNKYTIVFSIISEKDKHDGEYLVDLKLIDIKKEN